MNKLLLYIALIFSSCTYRNDSKDIVSKKEKNSEAYEALQFLGAANAFPNIDIPPDAYGRAWNYYRTHYPAAAQKSAQSLFWESIGPSNVGGRAISIAIHPSDTGTIWMGSASGGLWKSETGGIGFGAWQYIPTGFPVLGVGAIAINPQNPSEIFIGTGETYDYGSTLNGLSIRTTRGSNGIGILKSSDGGITWTHSLNWTYNQNRGVWDIIYDYQNPNTIYAATTEGIYKTTDGGINWAEVFSEKMVMDLAMDPVNPARLFAGVGNLTSANKGLYQSVDSGATWQRLSNGLPPSNNTGRISVDIYKQNPDIIMTLVTNSQTPRGLYRSTNGGASWTLQSSADIASYQGWFAKCLKISDYDSSTIYIGGVDLWKSDNGGSNAYQITFSSGGGFPVPWPDLHDLISNPLDPDKFYLLTDAGLYRSDDAGISWYYCSDGYNASQFYHGSISMTDSAVGLGGLQDRNTRRYNGTSVWLPVLGGDGAYNAIDPVDDYVQYAAYQYLALNKSTNRGFSFTQSIFNGVSSAFIAPYLVAPSDNFRLYAGDRAINTSADQGMTWQTTVLNSGNNPVLSIDVSHADPYKLYFATVPNGAFPMKAYLSTDGAQTYTEISTGLPNRYPRDISVDPYNDNIVYMAFSGFGTGHIYKSVNSGTTWSDVSGTLPDVPFHTVLVAPYNSNIIFAGSDHGVFVSTDAGASWQAYNSGFPDAVMVFDLQYSPSDHTLVAFTHGNGAYKTDLDNLVVTVEENNSVKSFRLFPSLTYDNITIAFQALKNHNLQIAVYDIKGTVVKQHSAVVPIGWNEIPMSVSSLSAGTYLIIVSDGNKRITEKFIKM